MKTLETFFVIVAILLATFLLLPAGLNYSGFCFEQKRWLSDEEKIRLAVERVNERDFILIKDKNKEGSYISLRSIPYKNVDEFLQKNPDCCKIVSYYYYDNNEGGSQPFEFWDYFLGGGGGYVVQINYTENYYDEDGIRQFYKVERQSVNSNCGNEYHWEH